MFSGKTDDRGLWAGIQAGVLFFLAALVREGEKYLGGGARKIEI